MTKRRCSIKLPVQNALSYGIRGSSYIDGDSLSHAARRGIGFFLPLGEDRGVGFRVARPVGSADLDFDGDVDLDDYSMFLGQFTGAK